jgi:type IV secretory pathway VirB2 component (pilin)
MQRRKTVVIALTVMLAVLALAAFADPALAKSAKGVGDSIQKTLGDLAKPIVTVVGGVIGIAAIVKRDVGMGLTLLVITLIVSAFLWAPDEIGKTASSLANTIFG